MWEVFSFIFLVPGYDLQGSLKYHVCSAFIKTRPTSYLVYANATCTHTHAHACTHARMHAQLLNHNCFTHLVKPKDMHTMGTTHKGSIRKYQMGIVMCTQGPFLCARCVQPTITSRCYTSGGNSPNVRH